MDKVGTIRTGLSHLDPYVHAYIGLQIADPLYINFRQTAEVSNPLDDAKHLYPGVDLKLRLAKEKTFQPEVSIGIQSALGHKRMAGEFIALSKRYKSFDTTLGVGWGRYGTAGHFTNPLKSIHPHFGKTRNGNTTLPNEPKHWFTGEHIGIFGGIEYTTPLDGLSVKLDYGADRYTAEQASFNYKSPSPWAIGLSYTPTDWINTGIAIQGTDKIMGRLSIQSTPEKWPLTYKSHTPSKQLYKHRSHQNSDIAGIIEATRNEDIHLSNIHISKHSLFTEIEIPEGVNTPQHIGRAIRHISARSDIDIEEFIITPIHQNLRAKSIKIMRKDIENYVNKNQSSPQEIWNNTEFITAKKNKNKNNESGINTGISKNTSYNITLDNQLSLSEEDSGVLYRTSLITGVKTSPFLGFFTGASLRLNIKDNLQKLDALRPPSFPTIKGNVNDFTNEHLSVENAHLTFAHSLSPSWHTAISAGYLEEFYAGAGAQILYRPFSSRFALGAEIWQVAKRAPNTFMNVGLNGTTTTTGHINAWYDIPHHEITLKASVGRFLATDIGASLGLQKQFKNGATLDTGISISNRADTDIFGGTTHAHHHITLNLPIGSLKHFPQNSKITNTMAPFGRNSAQSLKKPFDVYQKTESLSLKHIADHWSEILD